MVDIDKQHRMLASQCNSTTNFGQRHKTFQDILLMAREKKILFLVKARYADGQSIATRLARRISSNTDSLKRPLTKFNSMARDTLEETAYHLPEKLNWELVTNAEHLTSLEVNSIINSTAVPTELSAKIVRAFDMKKRAKEEVEIIHQEISQIADFYTKEHLLLKQHIDRLNSSDSFSCFNQGCLNLLYHRLLSCEVALTNFSNCVSHYHSVRIPKLSLVVTDASYDCSLFESGSLPSERLQSDSSDSEDDY